MTLAELVDAVYTITGRPDRVAETSLAIKSATLKAHQSDYYYKDLCEQLLTFASSDYVQQLEYRVTIPNFRAIKYLRYFDNVSLTAGKFLTLVTPEQVLDATYSIERSDIYYASGAIINIKLSTQQQYLLSGFYEYPNITDVGYSSWVALDHPFVIIYDAAATVFKAIGKDEEAAAFRTLVTEQLTLLRNSNILANGW